MIVKMKCDKCKHRWDMVDEFGYAAIGCYKHNFEPDSPYGDIKYYDGYDNCKDYEEK